MVLNQPARVPAIDPSQSSLTPMKLKTVAGNRATEEAKIRGIIPAEFIRIGK